MKFLDRYNEKDLIFFDIETAPLVKVLKKGTPLWDAWEYKCRNENEHLRKTGEVLTNEEYYAEKSSLYGVFAQVVAIVAGRITDGDKLSTKKYTGKEPDMLKSFNDDVNLMIEKNPATAFCGWSNFGFDGPFLMKRMIVHSVKPNNLLDTAGEKPWTVSSIDLKELWKGTGFYPDSLIAVATALGLPSPKIKMDGTQVAKAFFAGKIVEIADYCEQDVLTTANIFRRFKNQPLLSLK